MSNVPTGAVVVYRLVKRYGSRTAVNELTLTAHSGQITAILGPNGAGKTTTIEVCEGLRSPDEGVVRILGLDPVADAAALRPRVGVMLQDGGLPSGARTRDVLRLVSSMYANPLPLDVLVDSLGLADFLGTTVRRLSGGQRQRLSLALALVGQPEVVFLDEPTAGLDPAGRRRVWELVEATRAAGCAVILTTHLIDEAERLADHVVLVSGGQAVAAGTIEELTRGTQDTLLFQAPPGLDVSSLAAALPLGVEVAEYPAGHYTVVGNDTSPITPIVAAALTSWCAERGVLPDHLHRGRLSLEDVVLALTGWDTAVPDSLLQEQS